MTYFKIDMPNLKQATKDYKTYKEEYLEDVGYVYSNLGYVESAWNDQNAYAFIDRVKKDKNKIKNYFIYLDNLYEEIKQFRSNLNDIFEQYGHKRNTVVLKFDDSELDDCIKYLNKAISLFDSCLENIKIEYFNTDFEYIELVENLIEEIKKYKTITSNIIKNINSLSESLNNEIDNSKFRMKRIEEFNFNLKNVDYTWKTVQLDIKK